MKRVLLFSLILGLFSSSVYAGGILTNGNQSAQYIRMLSRNASVQVDGVYFNPAGLTQLENGFHFSLSNQSIFQNRTIENTYVLLNQESYDGGVTIPFFPNAYAIYKKDKLALSFGFGVNGGGGTVEYQNGLPSFEMPIATVLRSFGADSYTTDLYFKGYSAFMGYQFNASYQFCDVFSASVGVRMIDATNKYKGQSPISMPLAETMWFQVRTICWELVQQHRLQHNNLHNIRQRWKCPNQLQLVPDCQ